MIFAQMISAILTAMIGGYCLPIVLIAVGVACDSATSPERPAGSITVPPVSVDDVHVLTDDARMAVFYRTPTQVRDCAGHQRDVRVVWPREVTPRLREAPVPTVVLWPEDHTGQSVSLAFERDANGAWSTKGPCPIALPAEQ